MLTPATRTQRWIRTGLAFALTGMILTSVTGSAQPLHTSQSFLQAATEKGLTRSEQVLLFEDERLSAELTAKRLGVVDRDSSAVDTIPSLMGYAPDAQATKCYLKDPGPPEVLHEIDCKDIVIVKDE